jgi:hypothetical protein
MRNDQYLPLHQRQLHGIVSEQVLVDPQLDLAPEYYYTVDSPDPKIPVTCPVPTCLATLSGRYHLHHHFTWHHPNDILVIQHKGIRLQCPNCHPFLSPITDAHFSSVDCHHLTERRHQRNYISVLRAASQVVFHMNN